MTIDEKNLTDYHAAKVSKAIDLAKPQINEHKLKLLLRSFITGAIEDVPEPLIQLMSAFPADHNTIKLRWIPFYMFQVLEQLAEFVKNDYLTGHIKEIVELFEEFAETDNLNAREKSGALFAIVVLIRCICNQDLSEAFRSDLLPIGPSQYTVSFTKDSSAKTLEEVVNELGKLSVYPHITVVYPTVKDFELYDVVVIVDDTNTDRKIFGYQLTEGKKLPKNSEACISGLKSFVVKDLQNEHEEIGSWHVASRSEISDFYAISGAIWTPMSLNHILGNH